MEYFYFDNSLEIFFYYKYVEIFLLKNYKGETGFGKLYVLESCGFEKSNRVTDKLC